MLPNDPVIREVATEMNRAMVLHGPMPSGIAVAGLVVAEECGELMKAIYNYLYHDGSLAECREEALHTAATALRFIEALDAGRMG